MKAKNLTACLLIITFVCIQLTSCRNDTSDVKHEPLTIMTGRKDYTEFVKAFNEVYPEVELEFISYSGENCTYYAHKLLEVGHAPDIYSSNVLPDEELQKKYLIDLSVYNFSAKYAVSRLNECNVDGAIYMLPCNYTVFGIYYNKTLFEKHGWSVPKSFRELEELVPKIEAANVNISATALEYIGSGFQYLFNLGDTVFLRTPKGFEWVESFLNGDTTADGVWEETLEYVQKWIDIGMISGSWYKKTTDDAMNTFIQGNTAFYIQPSIFRFSQYEDGSGDRYGIMPWLSEDGSNNRYITCTNCYFGLNAELEKPKNKQKLQDALKFMDFVSTEEGQRLLQGGQKQLLPLNADGTQSDEEYREVIKMLDAGYSAPLAYMGWEDLIVPAGIECNKWFAGKSTGEQVIAVMNSSQKDSLENKRNSYAEIETDLTLDETASLIGTAFSKAVGADCSLISLGAYHDGNENKYGVNGCLWQGSVIDEDISSVNPLGWVDTIKTVTLTGEKIKQLAEEGFDLYGDGNTFRYVLTINGCDELADKEIYTVVICGCTEEIKKEGKLRDTQVIGMDTIRDYLSELGTVTKSNICG